MVGDLVVADAEEERMARATDATDPDAIAALREKIAEHRARLETALVLADREDYCEFPKWVDGPDGRIIVHSAAEEQAAREAAAEKAARAFTFQPSPKARQRLDQAAADGRELSEVISTALEAGGGAQPRSAAGAIEYSPSTVARDAMASLIKAESCDESAAINKMIEAWARWRSSALKPGERKAKRAA